MDAKHRAQIRSLKTAFIIAFLLLTGVVSGQTSFLKEAVTKLDRALVQKDTGTLKQLLHKDLSYGHSNGWVENRNEVIKNLVQGKLTYKKIETKEHKWMAGNDWASVRFTMEMKGELDGKPLELMMHVLQVWLKTNRGWQLMARQSTKI
jgi:hypothetical protein